MKNEFNYLIVILFLFLVPLANAQTSNPNYDADLAKKLGVYDKVFFLGNSDEVAKILKICSEYKHRLCLYLVIIIC